MTDPATTDEEARRGREEPRRKTDVIEGWIEVRHGPARLGAAVGAGSSGDAGEHEGRKDH